MISIQKILFRRTGTKLKPYYEELVSKYFTLNTEILNCLPNRNRRIFPVHKLQRADYFVFFVYFIVVSAYGYYV